MDFAINLSTCYASSLIKHAHKNLVSIFKKKLVSGDLCIMSLNGKCIIICYQFRLISFEALAFLFLSWNTNWFQFLPWLPRVSETYMLTSYRNYLSSQCICLFLSFMHLTNSFLQILELLDLYFNLCEISNG